MKLELFLIPIVFFTFLFGDLNAQQYACQEYGCTNACPNDNSYAGEYGPLGCADAALATCDFAGTYAIRQISVGQYMNVDVRSGYDYQFAVFPNGYDWRLTGYNGSTAIFAADDQTPYDPEPLADWHCTFNGTIRVLVDYWSSSCGCSGSTTQKATLYIREVGKLENHWFGFTNDLWTTGSNWCRDAPPTPTDNAIIPNTDPWGGRYPRIRNGETGSCYDLEIHSSNGAIVNIETGATLNVAK